MLNVVVTFLFNPFHEHQQKSRKEKQLQLILIFSFIFIDMYWYSVLFFQLEVSNKSRESQFNILRNYSGEDEKK